MPGHPDAVARGLTDLTGQVRAGLLAAGWIERHPGGRRLGTFTHPAEGGLLATAQLDREPGVRWPDDWPVRVRVQLGITHGPALDLGVLLTQPGHGVGRFALVDNPAAPSWSRGTLVDVENAADVPAAAGRVLTLIAEHAVVFADLIGGVDGLIAHLCDELDSDVEPADGKGNGDTVDGVGAGEPPDPAVGRHRAEVPAEAVTLRVPTDLAVLLAAAGRHAELETLLVPFRAAAAAGSLRRDDRRFLRQLDRWETAGRPDAPQLEETLAHLPTRSDRPRTSWSSIRGESRGRRDALAAAEAGSRGKSVEQVAELITAEYTQRGLDSSPPSVTVAAERIHTRLQPFGRLRWTVKGIRAATSAVQDLRESFRHLDGQDPPWMRAPDRASYPAADASARRAGVVLDDTAGDWLTAVSQAAIQRIGDMAAVEVWLTAQPDAGSVPAVIAHIGDHRVGVLDPVDAARLTRIFTDAAHFDEDLLSFGQLSRFEGHWYLAVQVPDDPPHRPAGDHD